KKRFAYEIKKRQYGDYTSIEFELEPAKLAELENDYRINEDILRSLTYRISDKQLKQRKKDKETKAEKVVEK
ncbi:MAG: 30S ribosomal protein S6, partial [Calditrichaeota bacterium]|nr:30S ribosomal protein S6 [Calditrichota bacterium]